MKTAKWGIILAVALGLMIPSAAQAAEKKATITPPPFFFTQQRDASVKDSVTRGKKIFRDIGCVGCHPRGRTVGGTAVDIMGFRNPVPIPDPHRCGGPLPAPESGEPGGERRAVQRPLLHDVHRQSAHGPLFPEIQGPRILRGFALARAIQAHARLGGEAQGVHEDGAARGRRGEPMRSQPLRSQESMCEKPLRGEKSVRQESMRGEKSLRRQESMCAKNPCAAKRQPMCSQEPLRKKPVRQESLRGKKSLREKPVRSQEPVRGKKSVQKIMEA